MSELNSASELAEDVLAVLPTTVPGWRQRHALKVELRLQPTFDLLKQIHELVKGKRRAFGEVEDVLHEIELLTREYDTEAKENQNDEAFH